MQLRYQFYHGGDKNPYDAETLDAYRRLTAERNSIDPEKKQEACLVFPKLDSWAKYLIANSKSVFWKMERAISKNAEGKAEEIYEIWEEALRDDAVGDWLKMAEAEEATKAMCYYLCVLNRIFEPDDNEVDFRYYISEGKENPRSADQTEFSLEAYE